MVGSEQPLTRIPDIVFPPALLSLLNGATLVEIHEGWSGAGMLRVERAGFITHYLKIAPRASELDLQRELAVMLWLQKRLPVPEVVYYAEHGETQFLLTTALPGLVVYHEGLRDRLADVIRLYAEGLRLIHRLPIESCPFDARLDVKIAAAHRRLIAQAVDEGDFDSERQGRTAESVYTKLLATRPDDEDLVFTHGDYCTPNVLIDPQHMRVSGFIDWGRAGIADRYQDLALAARSIEYNFGAEWVQPFFDAYGITEIDQAKVAFYKLLDEFF
jgi:aminoglycoside phosphotransferase